MNEFDKNPPEMKIYPNDIFFKIWTSPREVFKFINDYRYEKHVTLLLVLSGIARSFDRASMKNMGDHLSIWAIIGLSIVIGGLFGWITYYIYAALISWTGKWLDGKGDTQSILRILSYALLPSIVALIFLIPQIAIYGNEIFKSDGDIYSSGLFGNIVFYTSLLFEVILSIWTIVLCVIGLSEVQKISIGKSILNLLLPIIIFLSIILVIVLIFKLLA